MSRTLPVLILAAGALAFAGCGDDDDDAASGSDAGSGYSAPGRSEPAEPRSKASGTKTVAMKDIAFAPENLTVKVGTRITWRNEDSVQHNVVADKGATFESETFGRGGTFEFTADRPGEIAYDCTLHPGMEGTITVEK